MKSFISPLYIQTNSLSSEKIVLGLIMIGQDKVLFDTSKAKIKLAEKLLDKSVKTLLDSSIQMIHNKINEKSFNTIFNEEYFTYLSKYSNGLIQFGSLKPIAAEINELSFKGFFKSFVGDKLETEKSPHQTFQTKVKEKLSIPGVIEKADINYTLKPIMVEGVLKPTIISLLTTNGNIQALQAIDFENSENVIANHVYEFEVLTKILNTLSLKHLNKPGAFKIIVKEPSLNTPQHVLFDTVYNLKKDLFQIVEEDGIANEVSKIQKAPHLKFSTFLETK